MLNEWAERGVALWYCVQTPGAVVHSPSTARGAAHLVLSVGPALVQTAWNAGVTAQAFQACLGTCAMSAILLAVSYLPSDEPVRVCRLQWTIAMQTSPLKTMAPPRAMCCRVCACKRWD